MTIDILDYELKYKNDRAVLDLLEVYREQEQALSVYEYTESDLIDAEQEGRDFMKREIDEYADELEDALGEDDKIKDIIRRMRI